MKTETFSTFSGSFFFFLKLFILTTYEFVDQILDTVTNTFFNTLGSPTPISPVSNDTKKRHTFLEQK